MSDEISISTNDRQRINGNRLGIDLSFRNISYTVNSGKKAKTILHDMSGIFRAGQLSAIMGPSGAGKSSLMNILAGFTTGKVVGKVEVDGTERQLKLFRKRSAYITQADHLLQHLTVAEYLEGASHLKLGNKVSDKEKKSAVENVMTTLNLVESRDTRVSCLSGGERKRLAIGLELLTNPSILFLDEPTSGLDSSSSKQCVKLLQEIAHSGRTVVATIHQPSSRLLEQFDHLYIVADGSCMYQGPVDSLVPFLEAESLICPGYHNPADFVMDVASEECRDVLKKLVSNVDNGRLVYQLKDKTSSSTGSTIVSFETSCEDNNDSEDVQMLDGEKTRRSFSSSSSCSSENPKKINSNYPAPFYYQIMVLTKRTWLSIWREKMLTLLRFAAHVVVGILMGLLYWRVGNDAASIYNNAGLLFFNQLFILFAAMMPTIVTFPLEMDVIVREQLNHWYSLKAYYLAKTLVDVPFQIIFPTFYLAIVHIMTDQPLDAGRFLMVLGITIGMAAVAQGIGLLVGALCSIPVAVFVGPASSIPWLLFSGFFVNLTAIPIYMQWITYISFMRYAFEGSMLAIYGYGRSVLSCSLPYCYFRYPDKFLEQFDMLGRDYWFSLLALFITFLVIRILAYLVLCIKLRHVRN